MPAVLLLYNNGVNSLIDFNFNREEFFLHFFENRFFFQKNAVADFRFGWKDINDILYVQDPGARGIRLFKNGPIQENEYIESYNELGVSRRRIRKEALYRIMGDGGTLVMNRLELVSPQVRKLCMSVSGVSGAPAIANGYVAFNGLGSFGKHWDTHDVFAVQLFGRKRWVLYEPTFQLPTRSQTSRDYKSFCPATPVFDEVLDKGDILYIPRGWWHEALPVGEETFHVAIGMHGPTLADYSEWCCRKYLRDHLTARRAARLHCVEQNDLNGLGKVLASIVENPLTFEQFQRELVMSECNSSPFDLERFVDPSRYPILDDQRLLLNSALQVEVDRRYLPLNRSAPIREPLAAEIIDRLLREKPLSTSDLINAWPQHSPDDVRAAVRLLVQRQQVVLA